MSDVLGRVEHLESKSIQELALSEQTTDWLQSPPCASAKEVRDVIELGNLMFIEIYFLLELVDCPVELIASVGLKHLDKIAIAIGPDFILDFSVLDAGNGVSHSVFHGDVGDLRSALLVHGVAESGMVSLLDAITLA